MTEFKLTVTRSGDRMRGVLIFLGHGSRTDCVILWGDTTQEVIDAAMEELELTEAA